MDDLLIAVKRNYELAPIKKELSARFEMKDLNRTALCWVSKQREIELAGNYWRTCLITHENSGSFCMPNFKHLSTTMDKSYFESANQESTPVHNVPHRKAIRSLMYLVVGSRSDQSLVVDKL